MGGHEIRPNHMKVKATQFRQDAECGGSNPAALARQSLFLRQTTRSRRNRRHPAVIAGYCAVSVFHIRLRRPEFRGLSLPARWNDTVGTAQDFKAANFVIDVFALHRIRRTNDDKESRGFQRGERVFARGVVGGKILAVAKYRPQFLRQSSSARLPTH